MKISHIIAIVLIAAAIGIILSTTGDASKYVTFKEAEQMMKDGDDDLVHVVGKLKKDSSGNIIGMSYDPKVDPNQSYFILIDNNNEERPVTLLKPKPQGMEESEQIVIIGHADKNGFIAKDLLTKCPSKYKEENPNLSVN